MRLEPAHPHPHHCSSSSQGYWPTSSATALPCLPWCTRSCVHGATQRRGRVSFLGWVSPIGSQLACSCGRCGISACKRSLHCSQRRSACCCWCRNTSPGHGASPARAFTCTSSCRRCRCPACLWRSLGSAGQAHVDEPCWPTSRRSSSSSVGRLSTSPFPRMRAWLASRFDSDGHDEPMRSGKLDRLHTRSPGDRPKAATACGALRNVVRCCWCGPRSVSVTPPRSQRAPRSS